MDKSAIYIPDPTVLPHRVCYMGFFSPNMVRPGTSSLVAETTTPPGGEIDRMSDAAFLERLVADLDRVGIIRKSDVILAETRRIEYAYPVYDRDYTAKVGGVAALLRVAGHRSTGAFRRVRLHQFRRMHSPGDGAGGAAEWYEPLRVRAEREAARAIRRDDQAC